MEKIKRYEKLLEVQYLSKNILKPLALESEGRRSNFKRMIIFVKLRKATDWKFSTSAKWDKWGK